MKENLHQAILYKELSASRACCHVCQWQCIIAPNKYGLCKMRLNKDGKLYLLNYADISSVAVDPIEKKPLFHFFPASQVLSLGSWGCNFHCQHCQNWQISWAESSSTHNSQRIPPQDAIELAKHYNCGGIAWTYNEPGIWLEYTLDSAKLAKKNNLYTVYVTNGYLTPEALDTIGPFLDAWRVDIKGFSDDLYRKLAKVYQWRSILEVTKRAKQKWGMHVEAVTNIIPTMNDDDEQLYGVANWIRRELGELTPWHITRFHPHYKMTHLPSTPLSTLERAYAIGRESGLKFVYIGNVPGHNSENTICYSCGKLNVKRWGYQTEPLGLEGSKCKFCGADLNMRISIGRG